MARRRNLTVNKHWASDVTFGAIVGMTCDRALTVRARHAHGDRPAGRAW